MACIETIRNIQIRRGVVIRVRRLFYSWIPVVGVRNTIKRNGVSVSSKVRVRGNNNTVELQKGSVLLNA